MKNKILLLLLTFGIFFLSNCSTTSRTEKNPPQKISQARKGAKKLAMKLFLEGNTLEAKGAIAEAILDYQEALRYDTSSGIYYALAKNYFKLNKLYPAMLNIRKALQLDSTNMEYYQLLGDLYTATHNADSAAKVYSKIITLDSTNVRAYFLLGELYEYNKPLKALKIFEKLLKITGPDFNVLLKIAEINERLGNIENTIKTIERLREANPTDLRIQKILIDSYIKTKKYDKALVLTNDALLTFPDDPALIEFKASILFKQGKFDESAEWYLKLVKSGKISFDAKLHIASLFMSKSKEAKNALDLSEKILTQIEKDSSDWKVHAYLGEIKLQKKEDSLAIEYFKKAVHEAEWNSQLWERFANVLIVNQKYQEIIDEISPVIKNFPDDFFLNLILGLAYSQLSKYSEGKEFLMKAVELDPNDVTALTSLGFTLNQLKETDAAIVYLERALKIEPENLQALSTLGLIYDDQKKYDDCDRVYEKALQVDSTNALILNNYAYSLAERGIQLERAYKMSKKAIEAEPENSSYLDTYGWILYRLNKLDSAKVYIQRALEKEKNATILEHLGDVYFKLREKKKALKYWKEALRKDKSNLELKRKIEENKF